MGTPPRASLETGRVITAPRAPQPSLGFHPVHTHPLAPCAATGAGGCCPQLVSPSLELVSRFWSPHPVLPLPDHGSVLLHMYINKNEIFNFFFFLKNP